MYKILNDIKENKRLFKKFMAKSNVVTFFLIMTSSVGVYILVADYFVYTMTDLMSGSGNEYLAYINQTRAESNLHITLFYLSMTVIIMSIAFILYKEHNQNNIIYNKYVRLSNYDDFMKVSFYSEELDPIKFPGVHLIFIERTGRGVDVEEFKKYKPRFTKQKKIIIDFENRNIVKTNELIKYKGYHVAVLKTKEPIQRVVAFENTNDLFIINKRQFKNLYRMVSKQIITLPENTHIYDL